ncbi:MAG TPA: fused MFS/spermidine synthase, partial [Pirellulales bacterium]
MKTRLGVGPVAFMLFVSGACALVYQTAWFRELRLVFGGSTAASAAVTAIFMAGLGLGNALLGKLAERSPLPLVWYARLEAGVALGAALSPALVDLVEWLYRALGGQEALGSAGATAVRLVLAALVLGFPAFLMGGTLPAAAIAVSRADDPSRRGAAVLYALNTFGAVAGALLTTFVLLEHLGVRATIWAACGVNLLVAVAAYYAAPAVAAGTAFAAPAPVVSQRTKKLKKREQRERESEPDAEPAEAPIAPDQRFWVYATAGIAGFSFMLME